MTVVVHATRNLTRNLDDISAFLHNADAPRAFDALLDDLLNEVIPALERFPELGSDFLSSRPTSREGLAAAQNLTRRLGQETTLRELIRGNSLLLYARRHNNLYLLAIRHHRQLSFDFPSNWKD